MTQEIAKKIIEVPYPLSGEQYKAVTSEVDYLRILAGPGAGKTEVIVRRVLRLLLSEETQPESVEVITFTEKGAKKLKSTLYKRAKTYGNSELTDKVNRLNVHTIDSLSKKIVQEHAGFESYDVIVPEREHALLVRYANDLGIYDLPLYQPKKRPEGKMVKINYFLNTVDLIENEMLDMEELRITNPLFIEKVENYYRFLKKHHMMTFKMMTRAAIEYLERDDTAKPDIRYMLVDEYQDINPAQDKLIRLLSRNAKLSVVGDFFQTIYQWRGSSKSFLVDFVATYPSSVTIKLENNYRSRCDIVDFINDVKGTSIFSSGKSVNLHLKHTREGSNNVYSNEFPTARDEARWIVDGIEKYISEGGSYKDIAVLYRSVKWYADPVISELRRRNIPYSIAGKMGLFIRNEVKAVSKLMAWLSPIGFFNEIGSKNSLSGDKLIESALADWQIHFPNCNLDQKVRSHLEDWKQRSLSGGYDSLKSVYEALLNILNFKQLDENDREQKLMIINLGQFSSLLDDVEYTTRLGGRNRSWRNDMNTLCYYLQHSRSFYDSGSDELPDVDAITISTIHQGKGLDWNAVFMPCLINGHLPSSQTGKSRTYMIDTSPFDVERYAGTMTDEAYLYYVAISRPKNTLVLTHHQTKNYTDETEICPFLEESLQFKSITRLNGRSVFPDFQVESDTHSANELISYSVSDLVLYNRCPHLYWLRDKCGYSSKFSPMLGYGKLIHYSLQELARSSTFGVDPHTLVDDIVENNFCLPFSPNKATVKKKIKEVLHNYMDKNPDAMNISETEFPLTIDFEDYLVEGKVDALIDDDGCKHVREYKTSDKVASKDDISLQIQTYAIELKKEGFDVAGSVAYLEKGDVDPVDVDEKSLEMAKQKIDDSVKGIQRGHYPPKVSAFCKDCDMRNICKFAKTK
jgi:DNA helicase-2/ATP-dependent DNA helicase PcrA